MQLQDSLPQLTSSQSDSSLGEGERDNEKELAFIALVEAYTGATKLG